MTDRTPTKKKQKLSSLSPSDGGSRDVAPVPLDLSGAITVTMLRITMVPLRAKKTFRHFNNPVNVGDEYTFGCYINCEAVNRGQARALSAALADDIREPQPWEGSDKVHTLNACKIDTQLAAKKNSYNLFFEFGSYMWIEDLLKNFEKIQGMEMNTINVTFTAEDLFTHPRCMYQLDANFGLLDEGSGPMLRLLITGPTLCYRKILSLSEFGGHFYDNAFGMDKQGKMSMTKAGTRVVGYSFETEVFPKLKEALMGKAVVEEYVDSDCEYEVVKDDAEKENV